MAGEIDELSSLFHKLRTECITLKITGNEERGHGDRASHSEKEKQQSEREKNKRGRKHGKRREDQWTGR